ncbi:hypothetical protein CBL_08404 [Carabus blaptoides fortunei]
MCQKFSEEWQKKTLPSRAGTSAKKKTWAYFTMLLFTTTSVCDQTELPERHVADIEMNVFSPFHSDDDTMQQANPRPGLPQSTRAETPRGETPTTPSRPSSNQSAASRGSTHCNSKRKRIEALIEAELQRPEHDETQHFLLSLAPMLRSMNPVGRLEVQMDIQAVLLKK